MKLHAILALSVAGLPVPLDAAAVQVFPERSNFNNQGDSRQVFIMATGFGEMTGPSLGAFDLELTFDPALFSLGLINNSTDIDYTLQLDLEHFGAIRDHDVSVAGVVRIYGISVDSVAVLNSQQRDTFPLARLTFTALVPSGISPLRLRNVILSDAEGNPFSASLNDGVLAVPEPGSLGLLCLGLAAWAARARHHASR